MRAACRVGLGLCWKSGVAAEVIGITAGSLGEMLYNAKLLLSAADLFAWTLVIILLSFGFEKLFLAFLARAEALLCRTCPPPFTSVPVHPEELRVQGVWKSFSGVAVLRGVTQVFAPGDTVCVMAPSGAGKTTVLNMLGGMDTCDEGEIWLDGQLVSRYSPKELTAYRRYDVGFVFQFYNLVQNLTALENVELASEICKEPLDAAETLEDVGLAGRMKNFPAQLSGGEQQRVSIARALAKNPKILLCDEPTGALDYKTGKQVLKLLQDTCRNTGRTVIVITHNSALTAMADRVIHIKSGTVTAVETNPAPTPVERIEW